MAASTWQAVWPLSDTDYWIKNNNHEILFFPGGEAEKSLLFK